VRRARRRLARGAVAAANSATLQELCVHADAPVSCFPVTTLEALLHAAPQLQNMETDVHCNSVDEAHRLLRNEPPFGLLRVRHITVLASRADAVVALAADVPAHFWLTGLSLYFADLNDPAAVDALVDVALARRRQLWS
jgi:hypothetical protein